MAEAKRVLVYGLAIAGEAAARALAKRGYRVVIADDRPTAGGLAMASAAGFDFYEKPSDARIERLVERCHLVVPSPGVPESHAVLAMAARHGVAVRTEIDLAFEWERDRPSGPRPVLAVTGTDGKTTTTLMAAAMLEAAGRRTAAVGNTDVPFVAALDDDVDAFVVECTSFRLAYTTAFAPAAATWLNLAEDHQDWHTSMASYTSAKARIWALQSADDVAIGFADDSVVMAELQRARARHVTFAASGGDYRTESGWLVGPSGPIAEVSSMGRQLPHDVTNALAAAATVLEPALADADAVASALAAFRHAEHRIQFVAEAAGVSFYDDSKATTPHAALAAIRAFPQVVLIAGGKNKGLDLTTMASAPNHVRAVVAIGAAGPDIAAAFDGIRPVVTASSMDDAVEAARRLAQRGDAVLLSPGCASYDWYSGYPARGADFARAVRESIGLGPLKATTQTGRHQ